MDIAIMSQSIVTTSTGRLLVGTVAHRMQSWGQSARHSSLFFLYQSLLISNITLYF